MFKIRFWPMTARPMRAMSALGSIKWVRLEAGTRRIQQRAERARRFWTLPFDTRRSRRAGAAAANERRAFVLAIVVQSAVGHFDREENLVWPRMMALAHNDRLDEQNVRLRLGSVVENEGISRRDFVAVARAPDEEFVE